MTLNINLRKAYAMLYIYVTCARYLRSSNLLVGKPFEQDGYV